MRRQLVAVSLITGIAHVAAFAKLWVTARLFGVGAELDGYNLALVAPTLLAGVVSGMVQTGLFPVRARFAAARDAVAVARFERSVLFGLLLLGIVLALLLYVFEQRIASWVAPAAASSALAALASVWPYAIALVALNAVGDTLGYLLAMRDRYVYAAAAPIGNALLGVAILASWPQGGLLALALSTLFGLALQVGICAGALRRSGFAFFGPLLDRRDMREQAAAMGRLAGWHLPGIAFSNLTVALPTVLLARFGEGAVSAFGYAYRLHASAVQVLIMAGSPILLARFAELAARGAMLEIARLLGRAATLSLLLGVTATVLVAVAGAPLLELVFAGRFDAAAAQRVGENWFWLTAGLAPALLGIVYAKLWQAEGRPAQLSLLSLLGLGIFLAASFGLSGWLGEYSVPMASSISVLGVTLCFWGFRAVRNRVA